MLSSTSSDSSSTVVESWDKYSFVLLLLKISANATHYVLSQNGSTTQCAKGIFFPNNNNRKKKKKTRKGDHRTLLQHKLN